MANKKWIYLFNEIDQAEAYAGSWDGVRGLLGGKGAGVAEMTRIGIPVPPFLQLQPKLAMLFRRQTSSQKECGIKFWLQ